MPHVGLSGQGGIAVARLKPASGAAPGDSEVPPMKLCRFAALDWYVPGDEKPLIRAIRRWEDARRAWATAHGFDLTAKYGERPGQDWWAFVKLCESVEGLERPGVAG